MASDPKHPKVGDQIIDASDLKLIDILPEQVIKLTKLRDGFEKAAGAILNLRADQIDALGLNPTNIARLGTILGEEKELGVFQPPAEKLAEMVKETRQQRRHDIAGILSESANQARRRAERSENGSALLGPLEDLLNYQFGPAEAAALTRAKNAAKDKAAAGGASEDDKATSEDPKAENPKTDK